MSSSVDPSSLIEPLLQAEYMVLNQEVPDKFLVLTQFLV